MNPNWPKQIVSAVCQHFAASVTTPFVFEGEVPSPEANVWIEFRRNGPNFRLLSKDYYSVTLNVNLAIMELISESSNVYAVDTIVGNLLPYFDTIIITGLGCMHRSSIIRVQPWGRLGKDSLVKQTTMEATFTLELEGNYGTA